MKTKSNADISRFWNGYFGRLSKIDSMIVGSKINVRKCDDALAYTHSIYNQRNIYINPFHEEVPKDLVDAKRFVNGLNAHEVGHQRFSDFDAHKNFLKILETGSNINLLSWQKKFGVPIKELTKPLNKRELSVFHDIWNIIEDTSIEYWT